MAGHLGNQRERGIVRGDEEVKPVPQPENTIKSLGRTTVALKGYTAPRPTDSREVIEVVPLGQDGPVARLADKSPFFR